jgi:YD repeat-containing protein
MKGTGYANPHAVTQIGNGLSTTTYAYDNNGNLISAGNGTTTTTYTYDYANRLTALFSLGATAKTLLHVLTFLEDERVLGHSWDPLPYHAVPEGLDRDFNHGYDFTVNGQLADQLATEHDQDHIAGRLTMNLVVNGSERGVGFLAVVAQSYEAHKLLGCVAKHAATDIELLLLWSFLRSSGK